MTTTARRTLEIEPPPELPEDDGGGALAHAVPMLGGLGSVAMVALMSGSAPGSRGRGLVMAGCLLLSTVGVLLLQLGRHRAGRRRRVDATRRRYLAHLDDVRARARDAGAAQRAALLRRHPAPAMLPTLVEHPRLPGLTPADPAFLHVRYGVGPGPPAVELRVAGTAHSDRVDPVAAEALARLLGVHAMQPGLPAAVDLRASSRIVLSGPATATRALARALVCSATATHTPEHLSLAVLTTGERLASWDWVKWLPHALSPRRHDALGPRRQVSTDPGDLVSMIGAGRHLLLVVDGGTMSAEQLDAAGVSPAVTVLDVGTAGDGALEQPVRLATGGADGLAGVRPDQCDLATAEALARRLSAQPTGGPALDLLPRYDASAGWRPRAGSELLRVPIGTDDDGRPVDLDLKESAQHGMGPHGLLVGATGSGKSELLRTLVLGLATTHSPEQLALVLVDFKGGATFAGMSSMPHVSAMITNLEHELGLVDRMRDALSGEMVRRQELLRDAGGYASLRDYERARGAGAELAPLPSLLVVVDEFSELLEARPDFAELFATIGRLGRSLGLHLLLASQRLDEGRLRGLESHLSYRIGLRTFSAHESRAVLGVPDAHQLPARPGLGFLKTGSADVQRFEAGYVSGPAVVTPPAAGVPEARDVLPWTVAEVPLPGSPGQGEPPDLGRTTLLDVVVAAMAGCTPTAHRIWLPPLERSETVGGLMPDLAVDPRLGLVSPSWRERAGVTLPVGVVDRPREQRQEVLTVSLSGAGGHVAVVGGPRSGKSTLLCTLVCGLALTTSPVETQVFVLDFGGGALTGLRGLPHMSGVGTRAEPDVVRRVVSELTALVDRRERRQEGEDDEYGEVYLVVDGWGVLRREFEDLEDDLHQLTARGLAFGFHLVSSAARWADYRAGVLDLLGTRLELRLGEPHDSEVDRGLAASVPTGRPGRGLAPSGHHLLAALPHLGDGAGVEGLVRRVAEAWRGAPAPPLRLLPQLVTPEELRPREAVPEADHRVLLLGLEERQLSPFGLDVDVEPHWLVLGDGRSGKTAALRTLLHEVVRTRSPEQAQLVVVDYRRSLLGEVPEPSLLHYLTSEESATTALTELAAYLRGRLPRDTTTADQLRRRSWWNGAEVYVVVDDYDLVTTSPHSPLQALLPLLGQAADVGLHLVLARRSGGVARALHEPVLQALRDLAAPALILSGSPDEGPLVGGVRAVPAPPGRGRLVTRERGVEVVQVAWREPCA